MQIIDGKAIAAAIEKELKASIQQLKGRAPCLAMVLVGDHPPSQIYVNRKAKACEAIGMRSLRLQLSENCTEEELVTCIEELNADPTVDGILVQLPLPEQINPLILRHIHPKKDVDGLHPENVGKLLIGDPQGFIPCTPLGIKVLLERMKIDIKGKHVVILGRSNLVGKPLAALLVQNTAGANASVTLLHRYSHHVKEICQLADVLIVAIGVPNFVKETMIKPGAIVIDVGINKIEDASKNQGYSIVGDVDFPSVSLKSSFISPVPGGVGPMTIVMLLQNTMKAYLSSSAT